LQLPLVKIASSLQQPLPWQRYVMPQVNPRSYTDVKVIFESALLSPKDSQVYAIQFRLVHRSQCRLAQLHKF
jgi:hypothetical protein